MSVSFELLLPSLQRTIRQCCFPLIYEGITIRHSLLGDDAGLLVVEVLASKYEG
jgi:hypothetical protein